MFLRSVVRSSLGLSSKDGYFDSSLWEANSGSIIESQIEKAGNSGQETILLEDFNEAAVNYCQVVQQDYDPIGFVNNVRNNIGEDKYNAINIIIDECSVELLEAWDYSFGGDSIGPERFGLL